MSLSDASEVPVSKMEEDEPEITISTNGKTDENDVDAVRALAEACARIEYFEEHNRRAC